MKALSVRQPYAEQIATGKKRVEYRSWTTAYRGPLVIVASLVPDPDANSRERTLPRGCVIAVVELVDVRGSHGDYEWILKSPVRCEPRPVKGKLSLWQIDDALVSRCGGA